MNKEVNFTFAGCGFLGIYHVGVASCLREYAPSHMIKDKVGGASAGAMVAALLLCEAPLGYCTSWTLKLAAKARQRSLGPMHPSFQITEHLRSGLQEILPVDAHKICNNRLHVSMTRLRDGKNVIIKEFNTREELIQALLCSAHIPLWSGLFPPMFKGERYVDGALSDNLPKINSRTVTVSPFAGHSDICPKNESSNIYHMHLSNTSIQFSVRNLYRLSRIMFPPHPEKLSQMCRQGFEDALAFLKNNQLVKCSRHMAISSILSRAESKDIDEADCAEAGKHHNCDCERGQDTSISMHPSVVTALEEAVEAVNSSYLLYMKNHRTYRTFSVICSPLYLPFDFAIAAFITIFKWLPSLRSDVEWLVEAAKFYTKLLSGEVITRGKHTYSARFVCQLAITEVQQTDITSDMVMTSRALVHDQRIGFGVGLSTSDNVQYVHNLRERYLESKAYDSLDVDAILPTGEHRHTSFYRQCSGSANHSRCSSRAVTPAVSRRPSLVEPLSEDERESLEDQGAHLLDTFEECIEVADHTEAVLAYYYKDEAGQLKTTEIFKLEREAVEDTPSPAELVSALAAKKLKRYNSTRSIIRAVNMEEEADASSSS